MQRTVAVGPSPVQIAWPRMRGMRQGFAVAHQDSNLEPKDYEFVANVLCLGKASIGKRKLKNKKVSCDSSLAQLDEVRKN